MSILFGNGEFTGDLDINNFRRVVSGNEARQQRVQKWMENWADSLGGQKRLAVKWDSQYPEGDVVSGDFKINIDFIKLIYAHGYKDKL